jgi:hypothetical protein
MATSTILNITQIAESQSNKYITHNDAINALEQASNDIHVNATVTDPETITEAEAVGNGIFEFSGGVADFDVVMPAQINSINAKRYFSVNNLDTTYIATIKASSGTGATVTLQPGEAGILYQDFEDIYLLCVPGGTAGPAYDIAFYFPGVPTGAQEMFKLTAARAFELPDEFAGSVGDAGVVPAASTVLTVKKNGSSIGTITIATGGSFTFVTTATVPETFAVGDEISVDNQATADTACADINVTFKGTRTL